MSFLLAACRRAGEGAEPGDPALFQELQADLRAQLPGASPDIRTLRSLLHLSCDWLEPGSAEALALLEDMALAWLAACDTPPDATLSHLGWVLRGFANWDRRQVHRPVRMFQATAAWLDAQDWARMAALADARAPNHASVVLYAFANANVAPLPPAALGGLATLACRNATSHAVQPAAAARRVPCDVAARLLDILAAVAMYPAASAAARRAGAQLPERRGVAERRGALAGKLDGLIASVVEGLRCDPAAPATVRARTAATQAIFALGLLKYRLSVPLAAGLAECIPALAPSLPHGAVRRAAELLCPREQHGAWAPPRSAVEALAARRALLVQQSRWPFGSDEPRCLQRALQRLAQRRA